MDLTRELLLISMPIIVAPAGQLNHHRELSHSKLAKSAKTLLTLTRCVNFSTRRNPSIPTELIKIIKIEKLMTKNLHKNILNIRIRWNHRRRTYIRNYRCRWMSRGKWSSPFRFRIYSRGRGQKCLWYLRKYKSLETW